MRFTKLFPSVRLLFRRLNFGNVTRTCHSGSEGAGKKGAVVCVYENNKQLELTPCGQELDQKCGGKISQQLNTLACELKMGKSFAITEILEYSSVAISCVGSKTACYEPLESLDEGRENVRWGVGAGVALLKQRGCVSVEVDPCNAPDAAAEAAELAAWGFDVFKTEECRPPCQVCAYQGAQTQAEVSQLWAEGAIRARAQNWARCLSDMPANKMTPVDLAQAALDALCHLGITVKAHDREWIEAQGMRAFLAVARGSCDTPVLLECCYKGAPPQSPPVLLAAKGVTFDSGGLCLKECHSMTENRGSMAGAAVVLAALEIVAKLKLPINVAGVIPICENMVSGQCMKVGDVVKALNGLSIQIENTDMEGRLMMADALVYGQSVYKPSLVIDVATFTHGVLMATGGGAFGCFSNSEAAWRAAQCAGAISGDRPWRFPLWDYFHKQITNDPSVDLRNQGSGHATPCLGAAFLKNFVCGDWVHMDITGVGKVAHSGAPPYLDTRRMTGRPTRTLAVMLQQIALASCEPTSSDRPATSCNQSATSCNQPATSCNQPATSCNQPATSYSEQSSQSSPCMPSPQSYNESCTSSSQQYYQPCVSSERSPPCKSTSPPCGQQPPASPPCGRQPSASPPCGKHPSTPPSYSQQPHTSSPCSQQPSASPPFGHQPPGSPHCGQQPSAPSPSRQKPFAPPPCGQQPSGSPAFGQQPHISSGGPCRPQSPTSPPYGQKPPTPTPCSKQPSTPHQCGQKPHGSPPCGHQPSSFPPCSPQPTSPTCRPPIYPSSNEPYIPTFQSSGGPNSSASPGQCVPTSSSPRPLPSMPPSCKPPGPNPNETCLPGQPAPRQNSPTRTCASISLTKHKCG